MAYEVLAKQLQRMVLPPCFTEIRFIYKGDRDHLEQESPKIRDIFKRDKTRFPVNFMLSSDVERFWLTPHDY